MSDSARPAKYNVLEPPEPYISDFGEHSLTTEAVLIRSILDAFTSPAPAVVVQGLGGTGKTTSLLGVGHHSRIWRGSSDAVWFISLGKDANPLALLEDLETVVRRVIGTPQGEEIGRLAKRFNKTSAATEAMQLLNDCPILLLIDDVWADEQARVVGQCTVFSLVQECLLKVRRSPGRLRIAVTTRDVSVATLVPRRCRLSAEPFNQRGPLARAILCSFADVSFQELQKVGAQVLESFYNVLDRCGGLQLELAIAGRGVNERKELGAAGKDSVWSAYASELEKVGTLLKETQSDHPSIYVMLESSLEHLKARLARDGVVVPGDLKILFCHLGVLKKQEAVPLSVVACIWGISMEKTQQLSLAMARLHLVSLTEDQSIPRLSVHDAILAFCESVLNEKPERKCYAHRMTVKGLELLLHGSRNAATYQGAVAQFWRLCDSDMDVGMRNYFVRNVARHMMEAGGEYMQRLPWLITDFQWLEARVRLSRGGNDVGGILEDIETLLINCEDGMDEEVKRGVELISDGVRLSTEFVGTNPRELAYQVYGRLNEHSGLHQVVDRMLWSVNMYAKRPWLKPGKGVLKAAGGTVVLSACLPVSIRCLAVLPNGEDVVVGGCNIGMSLTVFSMRFARELYQLPVVSSPSETVTCVAACPVTSRMFSSASDGVIRVWEIGTEAQPGEALLQRNAMIESLAVTEDGNRIVFGDNDGWLGVCDSTSGDILCQWRAHSHAACSLTIRRDDGMIVSGSLDETIARWELTSGREIGSRITDKGGPVYDVAMSEDGRRIAFATLEKIGVLDAETGNVLRGCGTRAAATCAIFGPDDETVHFGRADGTTAALTPDGNIFCDVRLHHERLDMGRDIVSDLVSSIVKSGNNRFLVSASLGGTMSVQLLDRFQHSQATGPGEMYELSECCPSRSKIRPVLLVEGPSRVEAIALQHTAD